MITRSFSSMNRNRSTCFFFKDTPTTEIYTYRIICRTMTSMCLSLMLTPCSR